MAINPVNLVRVSSNLRSTALIDSLRRNTLNLFLEQNRIATGNRFNSLSEDPAAGVHALRLTQVLEQQGQVLDNIRQANSFLSATDTAINEVHDLLIQAQALASEAVNSTTNQEQRDASAQLVLSLIDQLVTVGNRKLGDMYLFGGQRTTTQPFTQVTGGVEYNGDTGALLSRIDLGQDASFNLSGAELFGAMTAQITGNVDLNPALTADTRLADLKGAAGLGIQKGSIRITTSSPATVFTVDLTPAETVGDVIDLINEAAASAGLTTGSGGQFNASLNPAWNGISLSVSTGSLTVAEAGEGVTARDLGLLGTAVGTLDGGDTQPLLTPETRINDLFGGTGLALGAIQINNGATARTIDLSGAATVEDILNKINAADAGVQARINPAGTGIDIVSVVSGRTLSVSEAGGNTAALLGIRSLHGGTLLSTLNGGAGVRTIEGKTDLRITAADGAAFEVDLSGARTVQDVLDRINTAASTAGVAVNASLPTTGNGIRLQDFTGGAGTLRIERANLSPAIDDLGLSEASAAGTTLTGADPAGVSADSLFSALLDLHEALIKGDTQAITQAGERINEHKTRVTRIHGMVGARAKAMNTRLEYTEAAVDASRALLSEVKDLDYTEAITRFQQAQTALQANLMSGSTLLQLSLLDFIR